MTIAARDWGWRHAGRQAWAVSDLTFTIERGERVLLLGASGSGKSTLLHAIGGVLGGADEGDEAGSLLFDGQHPTRTIGRAGLVQQDFESGVVLSRVGDDVAFGLENLRVHSDEIWPRVREALDLVGLDVELNRSTSKLSGGQKQRLALAGALAMRAEVLLLDEPTANLDPVGVAEVREAVAKVIDSRDTTLIVVEHRVDVWADLVDRVIVLNRGGGLLADGPPAAVFAEHRQALLDAGVWVPGEPIPHVERGPLAPLTQPVLTTTDLAIGRVPSVVVQSSLNLQIPEARSTVVTGPNGVGKSTLALTLAGLLRPLSGSIDAAEVLRPPARRRYNPAHPIDWRSTDLLTRIGTVFQEPEHQFVTSKVADELGIGLRALKRSESEISARTAELLELLHLTKLAEANPFTLSGGEKRRLSVGTVLATSPRVIVLDEPTFGQDRNTWLELVKLVALMVEQGRSVVSVTHDAAYLETLGDHRIELHPRADGDGQ